MRLHRTLAASAATLAFFAAVAVGTVLSLPTTWIVDDDGGAGVNFTQIQPAINAAADGDLILVRVGTYSGFVLSKDLTILGEEGARTENVTLQGIDVQATLAALEFRDLWVLGCSGTVVLDELFAWSQGSKDHPSIEVRDSADVRLYELDGWWSGDAPTVLVDEGSRLEVVRSNLLGKTGKEGSGSNPYGGEGDPAVLVLGGSRVHVARSTLRGGTGGLAYLGVPNNYGGNGGSGLGVSDGTAIVTGRGGDLIKGGKGGYIGIYGYSGDGGDGARVESGAKLRYSNVALRGGACGSPAGACLWGPGAPLAVLPGGTVKNPLRPDPALERLDPPVAGGSVQLRLRAEPGSFSRLFVGTVPIVHTTPGVVIEKLVVPQTTHGLGVVPANGVLNYALPLDPSWTPGTVVHLQAMAIYPAGKIRRTNSVPLVVREP